MDKSPAHKRRPGAPIEKILVRTGWIILLFTFLCAVIALLIADYQERLPTANHHGFGAYGILFVLIIPLLLLVAIGTIILLSGLIVALIKRRQKAANSP